MSARDELERLRAETHYPLTRAGFSAAWSQACGRPPSDETVNDFVSMVQRLKDRAAAEHRRQHTPWIDREEM